MFCGLSIRMASLIFRSWSGHALVTVILWSSDCLGLLGVGWRTTCTQMKKDSKKQDSINIWSHPVQHSETPICVCKGWWLCFFFFFFWKWKTKVSQGRETEQCFALSPRRGGLISLCWVKELSCLPANAAAVGDQRALSQTKVTVTTGTSEAPLPERKHVTPPSLTVYHNNLTPQESTGWRTNKGFCFLKSFKVNVQRLEMFKDWKSDKREYISVGFCSNTSIMRKYQNEKRLL